MGTQQICEVVVNWASDFEFLLPRVKWSFWKCGKDLMKKAEGDGQDSLLALLDWRSTPTEGIKTSPVQSLMGTCTRTCCKHMKISWFTYLTRTPLPNYSIRSKVKNSVPVQQVSPIRTFKMWSECLYEASWEARMDLQDLYPSSEE